MSILVANKHRIYVTYDDSRDPREAATAQLIEMFARLRLAVMYLGDMTTDLTDSISGDIDILDSIASHASPSSNASGRARGMSNASMIAAKARSAGAFSGRPA